MIKKIFLIAIIFIAVFMLGCGNKTEEQKPVSVTDQKISQDNLQPSTSNPTITNGDKVKTESKAEAKREFKSQDLLDTHYDKHVIQQGEFGNITKDEYLKRAQDFVTSNPGGNILTKTSTNGDTIFYNKATNEFAVTDKYGNIRTYFKPTDGINYFNRQK